MHTQVKSLLAVQKKPKVIKTCLFRKAGRREGAGKVTGEFLPADIMPSRWMQRAFSGATSYLAEGPPNPDLGK